jgi:hypothetical protein
LGCWLGLSSGEPLPELGGDVSGVPRVHEFAVQASGDVVPGLAAEDATDWELGGDRTKGLSRKPKDGSGASASRRGRLISSYLVPRTVRLHSDGEASSQARSERKQAGKRFDNPRLGHRVRLWPRLAPLFIYVNELECRGCSCYHEDGPAKHTGLAVFMSAREARRPCLTTVRSFRHPFLRIDRPKQDTARLGLQVIAPTTSPVLSLHLRAADVHQDAHARSSMCSSFGWKFPPLAVPPGLEYKCHQLRVLTLRPPAMSRASPLGILMLPSGPRRAEGPKPARSYSHSERAVDTRVHAKARRPGKELAA